MSDGTRVIVGRSVAGVAVTAAVLGVLGQMALGRVEELWLDYLVHNAIVAIGFGAMVWMVIPSQPRNRVVWIAGVAAISSGLVVCGTAVVYAVMPSLGLTGSLWDQAPVDLPPVLAVLGMVANSVWVSTLLIPTLVVLHLPDGRLPGPRWRWLARAVWLLWASAVVGFMVASGPGTTETYGEIQRIRFDTGSVDRIMTSIGFLGFGVLIPACVAGMVTRYRRSAGVERQQLRWVAWASSIAAPLLVVAIVVETAGWIDIALAFLVAAILLLVGSFAVSIGRYRLYDIDTVINRTVVFAVLAGFIGLTYLAATLVAGNLIGQAGGDWAPIVATAAVAFAFEPVRQVAQRWANRVAYGHRATPYEVLADITGRLDGAEPADGLLQRLAELMVEGTGADRATVWLGATGSMTPGAGAGATEPPSESPALDSASVFPVVLDGEVVGALEVVKPKGSALSSAERELMESLAGSAGAVLGFQRLNASLAAKAAEIEASRRRLVDAEDAERRRLERELNEGVQQQILGLKVSMGLVQRTAEDAGSPTLAGLLAGLGEDTQAALDDVRNLARGIYPPILESDGLGPAVSALAAGAPVDVQVARDGVGRYPRDVEAAVYFDISEALTNAVKHAQAPIRVELFETDSVLGFTVSDSGPGFDPAAVARGSGLENLYDRLDSIGGRLTLDSRPGVGTTVTGEVPLERLASR